MRDITLVDLVPSCDCAAVDIRPRPLTIGPGESASVHVVLNLASALPAHMSSATHALTVDFAVQLQNELPAQFSLQGRVLRPFRVYPSVVQYDETLTEGLAFPPQTLAITALHPLSNVIADCKSDVGTVEVLPTEQENSFTLTFAPNPKLDVGELAGVVRLTGVTSNGERLPPIPIPVLGRVLPEIRALPEAVDFGLGVTGESLRSSVSIYSAHGRDFSILEVLVQHDPNVLKKPRVQFAIPERHARTARAIIDLALTGQHAGANSARLLVVVRDANQNRKEIVVPVFGHFAESQTPQAPAIQPAEVSRTH